MDRAPHGRSGEKGNRSNISVIPYVAEAFPYLLDQVTEERVLALFRYKGAMSVQRYALLKLPALNFVIEDALEGGVNAALGRDMYGKTMSFLLLSETTVRVPLACIPCGPPYRERV